MLGRRPIVAVVVDAELDDVLVGIRVIERRSHALVGGPHRQDAQALEPNKGSQEIVEGVVRAIFRAVFGCGSLGPRATRSDISTARQK